MPNDRELLELAAKAAGGIQWDKSGFAPVFIAARGGVLSDWNPLTDDGDALRLAVKLRLHVEQYGIIRAYKRTHDGFWIHGREPIGDDQYAATRRAIVMAAAEIGRGTP